MNICAYKREAGRKHANFKLRCENEKKWEHKSSFRRVCAGDVLGFVRKLRRHFDKTLPIFKMNFFNFIES